MKTFTLKDNEYQLLMSILKGEEESRSGMSCNDPYKSEERLFTKEERIKMVEDTWPDKYGDYDEEDNDGFMFNSDYVSYIINLLEKQNL